MSYEDAKKYEKMLLKSYIKKGDAKDNKKHVYRIVSMFPFQQNGPKSFEDMPQPDERNYKFQVQRYLRNETRKVKRRDPQGNEVEIDDNIPTPQHEMTEEGTWELLDKDANFAVDVQDFKGTVRHFRKR